MPGQKWNDQSGILESEFSALLQGREGSGLSITEAARAIVIPGRSEASVRNKLRRLDLVQKTSPKKKWKRRELAALKRAAVAGVGAAQLLSADGLTSRSKNAIAQRKRRLARAGVKGIVDPKRSEAVQFATRLTGDSLADFEAEFKRHGTDRPCEWFEWMFGIRRSALKRRLENAGKAMTWAEVVKMPCLAKRRSRIAFERGHARIVERQEAVRQELLRRIPVVEAKRPKPAPRVCSDDNCPFKKAEQTLYAAKELFRVHSTIHRAGGVETHWTRKCRYCLHVETVAHRAEKSGAAEVLPIIETVRKEIELFENALHAALRELGLDDLIVRPKRSIFDKRMQACRPAELVAIGTAILNAYCASDGLNLALALLEESDFDSLPELRTPFWELDELLRLEKIENKLFSGKKEVRVLTARGRKLTLSIFRGLGLAAFVRWLI